MPNPDKVAYWKEYFAGYSDEALLLEQHNWIPSADQYVAAVQILHARQQAAQQQALDIARQQHEESLRQEKILHRKTQLVAWLAVLAAVVGIVIPLVNLSTPTKTQLPPQSVTPAPVALPEALSSREPQNSTPQSSAKKIAPPKP